MGIARITVVKWIKQGKSRQLTSTADDISQNELEAVEQFVGNH